MKISITSAKLAPLGKARYQKIKALGFDAVDFTMMDTTAPVYTCREEELPVLIAAEKALAAQSGIEILQTHGPWTYPPADGTSEEREIGLANARRAIRATALLGCRYMVMHPLFPFGTREPEEVAEKTFAINVAFFRALMPAAHEHGVTVCLENMPFHHYSLSHPADILRVIRAVDDPHFAMCLDTGHVGVFPELDLYEEMLRVKDAVRVFHVHDNDAAHDLHQLPLFGKMDFAGFARAWRELDCPAAFSFECAPPPTLSPTLYEKALGLLPPLAREILKMK